MNQHPVRGASVLSIRMVQIGDITAVPRRKSGKNAQIPRISLSQTLSCTRYITVNGFESLPLLILGGLLLLPLAEIAVFILVGKAIGVLPTILLTVLTAVAGTVLLRQQGLSLVRRMQSELDAGRVPGDDMMQGAMIVLASLFLLLPGFLTDAVGLLLFIPPLRVALARFFSRRASVVVVNRRRKQGEPVVDLDGAEWTSTRHKPDDDGAPRISPWRDGN